MGETMRARLNCLSDRRVLLAIAGLAFYWPLFRAPFLGTVFSDFIVGAVHVRFYYDLMLGVIGLLLLVISSESRLARVLHSPRLIIASGACASFGVALLLLHAKGVVPVQEMGVQLLAPAIGLVLAGFAGMTLQWASFIGSLDVDRAIACAGISFAASFALGLLDFVPGALILGCVVFPAISAAFLAASYGARKAGGSGSDAFGIEGEGDRGRLAFGWAVATIVGCVIVGLLASTLLRSLWMHSALGYAASPRLVFTYLVSAAEAAVLLLMFLRLPSRRSAAVIGLMFLMVVLLLGIALCAFAGTRVGLAFIASSHTVLEFYLWSFLAVFAGRSRERLLRGFGLFLAIESGKALLSMFILPGALGIGRVGVADMTLPLSLCGVGVIALAFVVLTAVLMRNAVVLYENYGRGGSLEGAVPPFALSAGGQGGEAKDGDAGEEGVAKLLVERYGLTEREAEVAACLAKGNSVKRTAELLCLAPSSVQGYTKTIYRKMGITKKQSLIDVASTL